MKIVSGSRRSLQNTYSLLAPKQLCSKLYTNNFWTIHPMTAAFFCNCFMGYGYVALLVTAIGILHVHESVIKLSGPLQNGQYSCLPVGVQLLSCRHDQVELVPLSASSLLMPATSVSQASHMQQAEQTKDKTGEGQDGCASCCQHPPSAFCIEQHGTLASACFAQRSVPCLWLVEQ